MNSVVRINSDYMWDIIFAIGIILTTMTNLRSDNLPLGPGEIIILIWVLKQWLTAYKFKNISINHNKQYILFFWILIFLTLFAGMLASSFKLGLISSGAVYDIIAYLFSFLICLTIILNSQNGKMENKIKLIVVIGTIIFFFLALWWQYISSEIFGFSISYGDIRFSGGAKNPNQLGLFIAAVPPIALYFLSKKPAMKKTIEKIFWIFIFVASIYVGNLILSDALKGAWIISLLVFVFIFIYIKARYPLNLLMTMLIVIILLFVVLIAPSLIDKLSIRFTDWFNGIDQQGSRVMLWNYGIKTGLESPIFGLGPGAHIQLSLSNRVEVHNTYLDLFTQAGLVGLALFGMILKRIYNTINKNPYLITTFFCLLIYAFAHFVFRQPIFWIYLLFFADQINNTIFEVTK